MIFLLWMYASAETSCISQVTTRASGNGRPRSRARRTLENSSPPGQ